MSVANNLLTHAEIRVIGQCNAAGLQAKPFNFSFHYRRIATAVNCTEVALDTIFQANVAVPLFLALNNRALQAYNTVRFMDDPTRQLVQTSHALAGAVAGDSMPTSQMACILYRTNYRGKSGRGANRFFPISEADTTAATADELNAASQALWATFIAAYLTPLTDSTGNTWNPCVYARAQSLPTLLPIAAIVTNDIISALLNKTVRINKRRKQLSNY
jgi:hypothetical protein